MGEKESYNYDFLKKNYPDAGTFQKARKVMSLMSQKTTENFGSLGSYDELRIEIFDPNYLVIKGKIVYAEISSISRIEDLDEVSEVRLRDEIEVLIEDDSLEKED